MGKRGRRRSPGKREPNGRLSRRQKDVDERRQKAWNNEEVETMSVAIDARMRQFGLTEKQARDPVAETYVGRLHLAEFIGRDQYEAGVRFMQDHARYFATVPGPAGDGAADPNRVGGRSIDRNTDSRDIALRRRYEDACDAIQRAQEKRGLRVNLWAAVDLVIVQGLDLEHLVPDMGIALTVLAFHYREERPSRAA